MSGDPVLAAKPGDVARFEKLIEEISFSQLKHLGRFESASHFAIETERDVLAHWVAFVLITGDRVRLTFRVHFNSETSLRILSHAIPSEKTPHGKQHGYDFMKEYTGFCAAEIRRALSEQGISTVLSLPLMVRGFDQLFETETSEWIVQNNRWGVEAQGNRIFCSARIELRDFQQPLPAPSGT